MTQMNVDEDPEMKTPDMIGEKEKEWNVPQHDGRKWREMQQKIQNKSQLPRCAIAGQPLLKGHK